MTDSMSAAPSLVTKVFRWLWSRDGQLRDKALRGGVWLTLGEVATRAAGIIKMAVLGRLLTPRDFGLMGMALVVLKWLDGFTETGLSATLIQHRGDISRYLDTAWTMQILRGAIVALALLAGAYPVARFFDAPALPPLIQAVAILVLIRSLNNPAIIYLRKELDFRRWVGWRLSGISLGMVVAAATAYVYPSAWALVVALFTAHISDVILSYCVQSYRPRLRFDWAKARELIRFAKWISWFYAANFLVGTIDSVVVGRILGANALGVYQVAQQTGLLPALQISMLLSGVLYSALAKVEDKRQLHDTVFKSISLTFVIAAPLASLMTAFPGPIIVVLFGAHWASAVPLLPPFGWMGVAAAVSTISATFFQATARPNIPVRAMVINLFVQIIGLYPAAKAFDTVGVAWVVSLGFSLSAAYQLRLVLRELRPTRRQLLISARMLLLGALPSLIFASSAPSPPLTAYVVATVVIGAYAMDLLLWLRREIFFHPAPMVITDFAQSTVGLEDRATRS